MEYGPVANMESAARVVEGRFKMGSQYHFHMETHTCIVSPTEDGFDLMIPFQYVTAVVAKALNITVN
jgi:xanthine dehydrogenase/oxidase